MLVDDDVYIVKANALPIGESLTDETAYVTYKHRKSNNNVSNNYYWDERDYINNNLYFPYRYYNYNCGWGSYNYYNPHSFGSGLYYGDGMSYAFGNYVYDPFTGNYFYNPYYYNPYGYYSPYGSYCASTFYPYYYGSNGYYGGNISFNVPAVHTNQHSGPRGSLSGFGSESGRKGQMVLKSSVNNSDGKSPYRATVLKDHAVGKTNNTIRRDEKITFDRPKENTTKVYHPTTERTAPSHNQTRNNNRPDVYQQRSNPQHNNREPRMENNNSPKGSGRSEPRNHGGNTPSGRRN